MARSDQESVSLRLSNIRTFGLTWMLHVLFCFFRRSQRKWCKDVAMCRSIFVVVYNAYAEGDPLFYLYASYPSGLF